jgi:hypothetical protein
MSGYKRDAAKDLQASRTQLVCSHVKSAHFSDAGLGCGNCLKGTFSANDGVYIPNSEDNSGQIKLINLNNS